MKQLCWHHAICKTSINSVYMFCAVLLSRALSRELTRSRECMLGVWRKGDVLADSASTQHKANLSLNETCAVTILSHYNGLYGLSSCYGMGFKIDDVSCYCNYGNGVFSWCLPDGIQVSLPEKMNLASLSFPASAGLERS